MTDPNPAGDPTPSDPPAAPAAAPAPPTPTPPPAPQPPAQPAPPAPVNYRGTPDDYVRELREESKNHRLAAEKAQQERDAAASERDTLSGKSTQLERENFILRNASKFGVNPDAALDSNSFMTAFKDVDLSKEDDVQAAFKTALERNSALTAGPRLPAASGGGHQGGQPPTTTPTLEGAVRTALGG